MRGQKPIPTAILKLRKSSGLRKLSRKHDEPEPTGGKPSCPTWLDREGKAEWRRTSASLEQMGLLKTCDRGMLAMLCQNWSEAVKYSTALNKMKEVASLQDARRLRSMANEAWGRFERAATCFGLEPSGRSRIHVDTGGKKDDLEEFLTKRA